MGKLSIVLDPGHGKGDNAGIVRGYYEGTAMFTLAGYLKSELEKYKDIEVHVTRNAVTDCPTLSERGKSVDKYDAELFISLHTNSASESVSGVETFRSIKRPESEDLAKKLNKAVIDVMNPVTGNSHNRGVKTRKGDNGDYYGVIRNSVLYNVCKYSYIIEHGFHSNKKECEFLHSNENLKKIAVAEAKAVAEYFGKSKKEPKVTYRVPYERKVTASDGLNIRQKTDSDSTKIGIVKKDEKFIVTKESGNWGTLLTGGYISVNDKYSEPVRNISDLKKENPGYGTLKVTKDTFKVLLTSNLNMRKGASKNYSIILTIPKNTSLVIKDLLNGWGQVTYQSKTGYIRIHSDYMKLVADSTSSTSNASILYRVRIATCTTKAAAETKKNAAVKKGFNDSFIIASDGKYYVYIGSYSVKTNANKMLKKAKEADFNAVLVTGKK